MFSSSYNVGSGGDDGKVPTTDLFVVGTFGTLKVSELVQLKLNIGASDGDSTPPEVREEPTPTL